jgi:hypothetical protein
MYSVIMIYIAIIDIHRIIIVLYLFYLYLLWLLRYTELLLYLPSKFCRKIIYCNNYVQRDYDILQLLQYTELLLYLPS